MNELSLPPGVGADQITAAESYGRHMATGSLLTGLVRVGVIPLGVVAAIFLARVLGPRDLGVFAVASSIIWWAQQTLNSFFNRTAIKLIGETSDWQPVATALIQLQFLGGVAAGAALFVTAPLVAALFSAAPLADAIRLFAFAIPVLSLTQAHENAVIGRRAFARSAFFPLFFNVSRSIFILIFVGAGWGWTGAILAQYAASVVELAYARFSCRPALLKRVPYPLRRIARYSGPMFLDGFGRQLNPRVDLWSVQAFVGSTTAGFYSAAQSALSPLTSISAMLSPLLLATLTHALQDGHVGAARTIARHSLRLLFCTLPFVALFAGAAPALVMLVFGKAFLSAAPLVTWLSLGVFANFVLSFSAVTLAAMDRPGAIAAFTLPMLLASATGSLLLVPSIGAIGAAVTTMVTQWGAMVASLWLLRSRSGVEINPTIFARVAPISVAAYFAANFWQTNGLLVVPELLVLGTAVLSLLFAMRVLTRDDVAFLCSFARRT